MTNNEEVPVAKKARVETTDVVELKMDAANVAAITAIEEIEGELNDIIDAQSEAIIKLEQEYVKKANPVYARRAEKIKNVPDFWYKAFTNHPSIAPLVDEADEPCLKSLKEIEVNLVNTDMEHSLKNDDGTPMIKTLNYAVHFRFGENEYFENEEIVKSFYQLGEQVISDATEIKWKAGKNLLELTKQEADPAAGDAEDDEFSQNLPSTFFSWFIDHLNADDDELGETIREDLWTHALMYYLNEDAESDTDPEAEEDLEDEEA